VQVLDPRMQMLSSRLLTSTNDCCYLGNQVEGRFRRLLNSSGLHAVRPLPDAAHPAFHFGPNYVEHVEPYRCAIQFRWTGSLGSLTNLGVELMDNAGGGFSTGSSITWEPDRSGCLVVAIFDVGEHKGGYRLRLGAMSRVSASTGITNSLAEIEVPY